MVELPTGTVTFLFTDIEGSTRLLQVFGDGYAAVRDEHARIVRRAIEEAGGVEVSTAGDSFFAVFPTAAGAVQAAVAAQRGLATQDWSPAPAVRVRMGVHTGEGIPGGDDYVGIDVHRAARIASAGHGGQVIVSEATRSLVEHSLPQGVSLRALGQHRLKDIVRPEQLHDLVIHGLQDDFPPPRTLDARPSDLPVQLTSFVGREAEIAEVRHLLARTRLLTLTGAGGTGKTRLALRVAGDALDDHADGASFVDLSSVTDPALVPSAIARTLGVAEVAGRPIVEPLKDHLADKRLLLVVDNFEQVAEAAPVVEELLTAAPGLRVIVTSRIVLGLRGEQEYVVPPLEPPDPEHLPDLAALRQVDAIRLFAERAAAVRPGFQVTEDNARAVAEVTARLDGLPLAIELVATRVKLLSPRQILERLDQRLMMLTSRVRTVPVRQRTLRDAIAWSFDLLDDAERRLFARLSVFSGGWTLEAAEAICDPAGFGLDPFDGLASLADKSLIRRDERAEDAEEGDDGPRFSMLETIREFGQEQLAAGDDLEPVRRRHGEHFLGLAVRAESHLTGNDQVEWLDRCDREHANIRAALRWAVEAGEPDRAQDAAGALWRFWHQRGHLDEGRRWFGEVLAMPSGQERTRARAKALTGAGGIAWWQRDRATAGASYAEALAIERELGDPGRIAEALYNLAFFVSGDDLAAGTRMLEESRDLFRQAGDERGVAQVLSLLVMPDAQAGRWDRVSAALEEVVAIWRGIGDRLQLAFDLVWLAFAYGRTGRAEEARVAALEALELFREVDNRTGIGIAFVDLAFLALWEGRHEDAIRLAAAYESLKEQVGGPPGAIGGILEGDPAEVARAQLPEEVAGRAWEEGLAMSLEDAVAMARRGAG